MTEQSAIAICLDLIKKENAAGLRTFLPFHNRQIEQSMLAKDVIKEAHKWVQEKWTKHVKGL